MNITVLLLGTSGALFNGAQYNRISAGIVERFLRSRAYLEPKGEGETSMPRKRLRMKTLSPMCRKTREQGESVSLEPQSPVV